MVPGTRHPAGTRRGLQGVIRDHPELLSSAEWREWQAFFPANGENGEKRGKRWLCWKTTGMIRYHPVWAERREREREKKISVLKKND